MNQRPEHVASNAVLEERIENLGFSLGGQITQTTVALSREIQAVADTVKVQNSRIGKSEKWQTDHDLMEAKKAGYREGQASTFSSADKWMVRLIAAAGAIGSSLAVWKELL